MNKIVAIVVSVLVLAVIVIALVTGDTPQEAREKKADDVRVRDLQQIHYALNNYYRNNGELPETLEQVVASAKVKSFSDPLTEQPYSYKRIEGRQYEICATFDTVAEVESQEYFYFPDADPSYNIRFHDAGENCFTLSVSDSD